MTDDESPGPVEDLDVLVADFAAHVPEVLHAVVLSADGLPMTGSDRGPGSVYADWVCAVASGLITLAHRAACVSGYGPVTQALVAMEWGTLVIMAIGADATLAVLTTAADLETVAYAMTMLTEQAVSRTAPDPPA